MDYHIPHKANRVLNVILLSFLLILIRVWYLSCLQYEEHVEKARSPKRKTVIERIERATIRDRFNVPMAINQIQYHAAICYADIRQIPSRKWEVKEGKKERVQPRLRYIEELAKLLASEIQIDAQSIEDLIHGKASLFPHTPFIIKENLTEAEYHRLKALEKDWVGIRAERHYHRFYPQGKVGGDLIGHLGAISLPEYLKIANEIKDLQHYFALRKEENPPLLPKGFNNPLEVRERLKTLQEKSYTIHDLIGKAGVESSFDAELRGYAGKKTYEVDTKGNILRELPGSRDPVAGHCVTLSISTQMQQLAEELLIQHESVRERRHPDGTPDLSVPWIKGGAIVAMDPKTGEVLAMASYPRIDPNDFVPSTDPAIKMARQQAKHKWLEDEVYMANLWEGKQPLERERWDKESKRVYDEKLYLSWDKYIEAILHPQSRVKQALDGILSLQHAYSLLEAIQQISLLTEQPHIPTLIDALYSQSPHHSIPRIDAVSRQSTIERCHQLKEELEPFRRILNTALASIPYNQDKLLLLDICSLHVHPIPISSSLKHHFHTLSLRTHHTLNQAAACFKHYLRQQAKEIFHTADFQHYREAHFKEYLKEKRKEEKAKKQYAKPYTDYLERLEKAQFQLFWQEHKSTLVYAHLFPDEAPTTLPAYLQISLPSDIAAHVETLRKHLFSLPAHVRKEWLNLFRSFEDLSSPLLGTYRNLRKAQGVQLQKHLAAAFYPLSGFGYGRSQCYQQSTPLGSVFKLVVAYEALMEKYQQLHQSNPSFSALNPLTIIDDLRPHAGQKSPKQILGFTLDNKPIYRSYKGGMLLKSHPGIGKIDVIGAIEQSSNIYFSLLALDHIESPSTLLETVKLFGYGAKTNIELPAEIPGYLPQDLDHNLSGLFAFAIGQHSLVVTPLQTALMCSAFANKGIILHPTIIHKITGEQPSQDYQDPLSQPEYPFQEPLSLVGIDFPLFTAVCKTPENPYEWHHSPEIKEQIPFPESVRRPLLEGMSKVVNGARGSARPPIVRGFRNNPALARYFQTIQQHSTGKTGTAEILYKHSLDVESKAIIQNHVWFGGAQFCDEDINVWEDPELIVVVYLRFSAAGGKEGLPLWAEMVKKFRELKDKF